MFLLHWRAKLESGGIYPDLYQKPGEFPCVLWLNGLDRRMIGAGFLCEEDRAKLISLARDGWRPLA